MATSVVAREYRGQTLYLRGSEVPAYSWTQDRADAKRFTNADGWRIAREYNASAWAADGAAFVIDATGSVGKVAQPRAAYSPDVFKGRLSKWIGEHCESHNISNHTALAAKFRETFGVDAEWPHYSREEMARQIGDRGKGGSLGGSDTDRFAPDYRIAEHYAYTLAQFSPWQSGLGFRFRSALEALEKAGY